MFLHDYASSAVLSSPLKERVRGLLPKRLKKHRIHAGALKGCAIYTSWHDYPGAILGRTEKPLLEWFRQHTQDAQTWIDIGAHYGYTAIALARLVGERGRVFAFEPVLETAACLARTKALNGLSQLTVVPLGLNAQAALSTELLPTVRGMADSTIRQNRAEQQIFAGCFDSLWPSLAGDDPVIHGVKIDVQGMELSVLDGMRQTLLLHHPVVVVELHAGVDRGTIINILTGCGYSSHGEPIEPGEDRQRPQYRDNCSYAFYPNTCGS